MPLNHATPHADGVYLCRFAVSMDDLKSFRQLDSVTPGHPENFVTAGVEVSTGPLGQGISNAVGMAMAERHLAATFNKPDFEASQFEVVWFSFYYCCSVDISGVEAKTRFRFFFFIVHMLKTWGCLAASGNNPGFEASKSLVGVLRVYVLPTLSPQCFMFFFCRIAERSINIEQVFYYHHRAFPPNVLVTLLEAPSCEKGIASAVEALISVRLPSKLEKRPSHHHIVLVGSFARVVVRIRILPHTNSSYDDRGVPFFGWNVL